MARLRDPVGAIDLGGTNVRAGVVGDDGALTGFVSNPTEGELGPDRVIERAVETLDASLRASGLRASDLRAVGAASPGPLDWKTGVVFEAPNLPGWKDVPLGGRIAEATGRPVYLENDANAAALAEFTHGAHAGVGNMVYITVSTGVGGGLILDGELWHGVYGSAGEVGHMTVDFDGPTCACGNIGCVEAIAAGPDLAAWVSDQIRSGCPSSLQERVEAGTAVSGRDVVEAAAAGDRLSRAALERGGRAVGFAIVTMTHLLNLELAVVGGGIANAGDLLFGPIRRTVAEHAIHGTARDLRIVPWSLGENVGLLGAAAAARSRMASD